MEVFTTLGFLEEGVYFPPKRSSIRLEGYKRNLDKYKNEEDLRRIVVKTAKGSKTVEWDITNLNYYKLITDKSVGLLLNEKPIVSVGDKEKSKVLANAIVESGFWKHLQDAYRSFSSLGDGVLYLYNANNGRVGVNAINPSLWYKVVDASDINTVKCHVLVQPMYRENFSDVLIDEEYYAIRVLEHYEGYYIEYYKEYQGQVVGKRIELNGVGVEGRRVETGLPSFAVFDFNNSKAIDEVYGVSDYKIFSDALELKQKKVTQLDMVLDKHFDPILQVPRDAMRENEETGEMEFNGLGNIVAVRDGDNGLKYVSWDAKTDAILSLVDTLGKEVATLSEMGSAFLEGNYNSNISGEALKVLIKGALDKTSRHIDTIELVIKELFCAMLYLKGVEIATYDIGIEWQDGITEGDIIKAQTVESRVNSGTLSRKRVLMKYDGLTEEEAELEIDLIESDKKRGVDGRWKY